MEEDKLLPLCSFDLGVTMATDMGSVTAGATETEMSAFPNGLIC